MSAPTDATPLPHRVELERHDHVLVIHLDRTDKRNAIDSHMTSALDAALNEADDDPEVRCIILTGGERAFSAGTDLADGAGTPTERGGPYGVIRRSRRTPLIAAVEGIAYGGGFEVVLACDMVVAHRTARFGLPEVARGVIPTCGGLFRGWHSLPVTVAKQMVLTGRPLSAQRAYELGIVNELADDGEVLTTALDLAAQVSENSPLSVAESLTVMNDVLGMPEELGWSRTDEATTTVKSSEDYREGVAAFLEKRSPQWKGR
ncbi:enoyl-CoA hydratase-related protein [Brevibacterium jeotgali]|uniref:Enoyl-CoA hydratase/carnithine racemase n=1 Tax=Brevibacterium jeotgali TaxID=1262550 RepID=A0A2H1L2J0_9MICO|nr:enoyl-CoA hydratase-related protein [Brevibacterium jeotgali]TWC02327.1 enoyl-CoA hydratase/carnithine racemase [Brevibacterium jeotgali]SMY11118.1 Enoyl-CoA hydratase/carnithine racemase [Brevibacterium jeotgali]